MASEKGLVWMERPEYDLKETGKQLRRLRKRMDLSVEEVRVYMKLTSPQSVYKWEMGENFPTADNLLALAELYEVRAEEMLVKKTQALPTVVQEGIMLFGSQGMDYEIFA